MFKLTLYSFFYSAHGVSMLIILYNIKYLHNTCVISLLSITILNFSLEYFLCSFFFFYKA